MACLGYFCNGGFLQGLDAFGMAFLAPFCLACLGAFAGLALDAFHMAFLGPVCMACLGAFTRGLFARFDGGFWHSLSGLFLQGLLGCFSGMVCQGSFCKPPPPFFVWLGSFFCKEVVFGASGTNSPGYFSKGALLQAPPFCLAWMPLLQGGVLWVAEQGCRAWGGGFLQGSL